jgi:hypothetical protein
MHESPGRKLVVITLEHSSRFTTCTCCRLAAFAVCSWVLDAMLSTCCDGVPGCSYYAAVPLSLVPAAWFADLGPWASQLGSSGATLQQELLPGMAAAWRAAPSCASKLPQALGLSAVLVGGWPAWWWRMHVQGCEGAAMAMHAAVWSV